MRFPVLTSLTTCLCLWIATLAAAPGQEEFASFLPLVEHPATASFAGSEWNDEWDKERYLKAEVTVTEIDKGPWGRAIEIKIIGTGERKISPLQWVLAPDGAIYQEDFGDNYSEVTRWTKDHTSVQLSPEDWILPPQDKESGRFPAKEESEAKTESKAPAQEVKEQAEPLYVMKRDVCTWMQGTTAYTVSFNLAGDTACFRRQHPSGHLTTIVFQRGVGIVSIGMGTGAGQDGWKLHRLYQPVAAAKLSAKPDVTALFAALPDECLASMNSMPELRSVVNRSKYFAAKGEEAKNSVAETLHTQPWEVDASSGWLSIASAGDGEGETLQVAFWSRQDGSRLLGLHLQNWTAGPSATLDARLYEWRNGAFRLATFSDWDVPTHEDFYADRESKTGGYLGGDWTLPKKGTTIAIRPGLEDDADMLGPETVSDEDYAFELLWNGRDFKRVRLPREIPAPGVEPQEWVFQSGTSSVDEPWVAYLRRIGDSFNGELRGLSKKPRSGKLSLSLEGEDDGKARVQLSVAGKSTEAEAAFHADESSGSDKIWTLESGFGSEDDSVVLSSLPQPPGADPLPRFSWKRQEKAVKEAVAVADVLQFDAGSKATPGPWALANADLTNSATAHVNAFVAALKDIKPSEEHSLKVNQWIGARHEAVLSVMEEAMQHLDTPPGQQALQSFNYHLGTNKRLQLSNLFKADADWKKVIIDLCHAWLVERDDIAEGQAPILPEFLDDVAWSLSPANVLTLNFTGPALNRNGEGLAIPLDPAKLMDAGILKDGNFPQP